MTRRIEAAMFVASVALVPWVLEACGRSANVLEDEPEDGPVGTGGIQGGGTGGFSASGGSAELLGLPGASGGTGAGGGADLGQKPDSGLSTGGAIPAIDLHAAERAALAAAACELPDRYPCLKYPYEHLALTPEQRRTECMKTVEITVSRSGICWEEWAAYVTCFLNRTDYCPCTDKGCILDYTYGIFSTGCADTLSAYKACQSFYR